MESQVKVRTLIDSAKSDVELKSVKINSAIDPHHQKNKPTLQMFVPFRFVNLWL